MQALKWTVILVLAGLSTGPLYAQVSAPPPNNGAPAPVNPVPQGGQYSSNEVIDAGHRFFGTISPVETPGNGARHAGWIMLRLPREVAPLFREWLDAHYPLRAAHVMSLIHALRGGRDNDPRFGTHMTGVGNFAELIEKRFDIACRRFGLNGHGAGRKPAELDCGRFKPPRREAGESPQMGLF